MATFRDWQHIRWSGSQHKSSPAEKAITTVHSDTVKPKADSKEK